MKKKYYYAKEKMVKDLIKLTPYNFNDVILDAGSGKNKVWFNNFNCKKKFECEIEDSCNFYKWSKSVDWVIGNPPFRDGEEKFHTWRWINKASTIANKGMAFFMNIRGFSVLTPAKFEQLKKRGFYLQKICLIRDKRWRETHYYLIFTKMKNKFIDWRTEPY